MSDFVSNFSREVIVPGVYCWEWQPTRPIFTNACVKYVLSPGLCSRDEGWPEFQVTCEVEPHEHQQRAWKYLLENRTQVESILRQKLLAIHLQAFQLFQQELAEVVDSSWEDNDSGVVNWSTIKNEVDWESIDAVDVMFSLSQISLLEEVEDQMSYVAYSFATSWDEEHGIGLLANRDVILDQGGMGEF